MFPAKVIDLKEICYFTSHNVPDEACLQKSMTSFEHPVLTNNNQNTFAWLFLIYNPSKKNHWKPATTFRDKTCEWTDTPSPMCQLRNIKNEGKIIQMRKRHNHLKNSPIHQYVNHSPLQQLSHTHKGSTVISHWHKNKEKMVQTPDLPMTMKQYLTPTLTTGYIWPLLLQTNIHTKTSQKYKSETKRHAHHSCTPHSMCLVVWISLSLLVYLRWSKLCLLSV